MNILNKLSRSIFAASAFLSILGSPLGAYAGNYLNIDNAFHLAKDSVTLTIDNLSLTEKSNAHLGIFLKNDGANSEPYANTTWVSSLRDGRTWTITAPSALGQYEARAYINNGNGTKTIIDTASFTVGSLQGSASNVVVNKNFFLVRDPVTVSITGLTQGQISDAWAGVFLVSDQIQSSAYGSSTWISSLRDGSTWTFNAPVDFGTYEVRVFTQKPLSTATFFGKTTFTVGSNAAVKGDLSINKKHVKPGKEVTVSIKGLTQNQIEDQAFVGVFRARDAITSDAFQGIYTSMSSLRDDSTYTFNAPTVPGQYEVRVFTKRDAALRTQSYFGTLEFSVDGKNSLRFSVNPGKKARVNVE